MYDILDLGTLPGTTQSIATGINDQGQVVGVSYNTHDIINGYDAAAQSFLYSNGQTTIINPLGGPANAINDAGQVVGGFLMDINNAGQYIGANSSGYEQLHSGGQAVNLPMIALAINDSGQIVGDVFAHITEDVNTHAAIYSNGQLSDLNGHLGFDNSVAIGINRNGDILINGGTTSPSHSVLYANGVYTDLTALPGGAGKIGTGLNDHDQVVGNNFLYSGGHFVALTDLIPTSSGWSQLDATRINDAGQIIGQGLVNGQEHAFLMTPEVQAVPEPSSALVYCGLAAGFYLIRLRKRRAG